MKTSQKVALALDIIPYLANHGGITRREAAAHFGISPRELTSILEIAVCCGIPGYYGGDLLDIDIWGDNIYVYTAQGLEKPLRLTTAERAALTLALEHVDKVPGLTNHTAVHSVLAKLTGQPSASSGSADTAAPTGGIPGATEILSTAITDRRVLTLDYLRGTGELTPGRRVLPYRIIIRKGFAYLIAWSLDAHELRQFRLDRIVQLHPDTLWAGEEPLHIADIERYCTDGETAKEAYVTLRHDAVWLAELLGITITDSNSSTLYGVLPYFTEAWLLRMAQRYADYMVVCRPKHIEKTVVDRTMQALAR